MSTRPFLIALMMLSGCVGPNVSQSPSPSPTLERHAERQPAASVVPVADHHQHLLSPAGAALVNRPLLPQINVPTSIATVLSRRAEAATDASALATVFTDDALVLGPTQVGGWIRGGSEAAKFFSSNFSSGYRLTPTVFSQSGTVAEIAGYYTRGEGSSVRHPGYFSMTLTKDAAGAWRISKEIPVFPGPTPEPMLTAKGLIQMLDAAGIQRAAVLSDAYYFDSVPTPERLAGKPYEQVVAENDWTARQIGEFPDRLVGFCGFNPLADYAIEELTRCSRLSGMKGLKLHFPTSGVDVRRPEHVQKLRSVFEAANRLRMPIIAHTATRGYGRPQAEILVREVFPRAPDVPIIIAHLWGGNALNEEALAVFADAVSGEKPAVQNLYFELAQVSLVVNSPDALQRIVDRMRQIGFSRIFYGSDGPQFGGKAPKDVWADFLIKMPLSQEEFRLVAINVAPYLR